MLLSILMKWHELPFQHQIDAYKNALKAYYAGAIDTKPEFPTKNSEQREQNARNLAKPESKPTLDLSQQINLLDQPKLTIKMHRRDFEILGIQMNEDGYLIITNKEKAKFTIERIQKLLKNKGFDHCDGIQELSLRLVFEEPQNKEPQYQAYQEYRNQVINPQNPHKKIQDKLTSSKFVENLKKSPENFIPQALDDMSSDLFFDIQFRNSSAQEALNMFVNYTNTLINIKLNNPEEFTNNKTNNKLRQTTKKTSTPAQESKSVRKAWENWLLK